MNKVCVTVMRGGPMDGNTVMADTETIHIAEINEEQTRGRVWAYRFDHIAGEFVGQPLPPIVEDADERA